MRINHGKYYYDFLRTVEKLKQEDNSCFICGETKNIKPHHVRRFKQHDKNYADKNNIVLLCPYHHHLFHQLYGSGKGVNRKNFTIFVKKEYLKQIEALKKENNQLKEYKENVISTIDNAVKSERTCLGSSVLRNLAANLGVKIE